MRLKHQYKERKKELNCINTTVSILSQNLDIAVLLQEIADFIPNGWQYVDNTVVRICYDNKCYKSKDFIETNWFQKQEFETNDNIKGSLEIYYTKKFPLLDEGPFMKEERDLINNLAFIIASAISKKKTQYLAYIHNERLKELRGINETAEILRESKSIEEALVNICIAIPKAWQYPEFTAVRITYGNQVFQSKNFYVTPWCQKQTFQTSVKTKGLIEVYYLKEFEVSDEGPFMSEERHLLNNIAGLISGSITKYDFTKLIVENTERLKELGAINKTSELIMQGLSVDNTLQQICNIIPASYQFPEYTAARIIYDSIIYSTPGFKITNWSQSTKFVTIDNKKGAIDVFYLKEFPTEFEGPFLNEERALLNNLAMLISGYLNSMKARDFLTILPNKSEEFSKNKIYSEVLELKKSPLPPLQEFFDKLAVDKYIYLDMMRIKVKEILFVARLYDAFILENEDNFFEKFMGEIYHYSLFSLPRITGVTSEEEAFDLLGHTHFDIVVLMQGNDKNITLHIAEKIKNLFPSLPVYILINKKGELDSSHLIQYKSSLADKLFVWNGDSKIFFAIVKSTEDQLNVENDTKVGMVRIILLIEDSPEYYSRYLTYLYSIVFSQVLETISQVKNEMEKISKIRSRPKILLARNYEEASYIFNKYKDFILCVISDVEFTRNGVYDMDAGFSFIHYVKSQIINLPVVLQSSNTQNSIKAKELGIDYIDKNNENLQDELKKFIRFQLGFGDFIFRNAIGEEIAVAKNLNEFIDLLQTVPDESITYHSLKNQFSLWLMARGEIKIARILYPLSLYHFNSIDELRIYFIQTIIRSKREKQKGRVIDFNDANLKNEDNIVSLATGSLGGKGRGLAFINTLISNLDFSDYSLEINIRTPYTCIIGTDEYELFLKNNNLYSQLTKEKDPIVLKKSFIHSELSDQLKTRIRILLHQYTKPLAVRSSSLFEDSLYQPFSGVFDTYLLPNNHPDIDIRFDQISTAIKLVFLSVFSKDARNYFNAIKHNIEEEKMAVVIQEVVGNQYDNYFYPHISGVAHSFNFYPVSHMKAEEGYAICAVGLGEYIMKGGKAFRFSPKYPTIDMMSEKELLRSTQMQFYAIDLNKKEIDLFNEGEQAGLAVLDISEAEKHGTLTHLASVYDHNNQRIVQDFEVYGQRIVNFTNILKYNYIPLAKSIDGILNTIKDAFGAPVEIEFAVDLSKEKNKMASFYILQIKPLLGNQLNFELNPSDLNINKSILYSSTALGNGQIKGIKDIVFIKNEKFDKMQTLQMVNEIGFLNDQLVLENKKYILIGPGRWGSSDRFLGVPVNWSQICNAKVIVEISLDGFSLDASLGSHFFHNITSMNVGYLAIHTELTTDFLNWNRIKSQKIIRETNYFCHVAFTDEIEVLIDGKKHIAIIQ